MRGKALLEKLLFRLCRITPARAGKSLFVSWDFCFIWDHPRACGEKSFSWMWAMASRGSPPRVRGKDILTNDIVKSLRITPARAGKSQSRPPAWGRARDHPRACGEKILPGRVSAKILGSPPRVRGKGPALHCSSPAPGITPARAGKRVYNPL